MGMKEGVGDVALPVFGIQVDDGKGEEVGLMGKKRSYDDYEADDEFEEGEVGDEWSDVSESDEADDEFEDGDEGDDWSDVSESEDEEDEQNEEVEEMLGMKAVVATELI